MSNFTVDTHLFRELGELLVGRDSTALVELIKNAYDADATVVTVHAENLDDPRHGVISVQDDGIGMTLEQFEKGFLRIASRLKEEGSRVSPRFGRRYTGAKGIGRLAAHKLAGLLEVQSTSVDPLTGRVTEGFVATIDWGLIEQVSTLDKVPADAVRIERFFPSTEAQGGTVLKLSRLRRGWTEAERVDFVREAKLTLPPDFLTKSLIGRLLDEPLLFDEIRQHSSSGRSGNWSLELSGAFDIGEDYFQTVAEVASWVLEVNTADSIPRFGIAPTRRYAKFLPTAERVVRSPESVVAQGFPRFRARILIREGDWEQKSEAANRWRRSASGVMVYQEGFRVLPYGERGNDWLGIDKRYSERTSRKDRSIADLFDVISSEDTSKAYQYLPNRAYLGGVFLTLDHSGGLKILINREGFLPDAHFSYIQETMTRAVDFSVRVRSEAKVPQRQKWRRERSAKARHEAQWTATQRLENAVETGTSLLRQVRGALAHGNIARASEFLDSAERYLKVVPETAKEIRDEQAMVFTLASTGTQIAAFVHEIQSLVGLARSMESTLESLAEGSIDKSVRQKIARLSLAMRELRISLERQAAYVYDVASADARRRRARQVIKEAFESAVNLVAHHLERASISLNDSIPEELKSPPMFRAELVAIFCNLLTNAIKAAGKDGNIRASGQQGEDNKVVVRIENTGVQVTPAEGENWFRPFASSSANVDPGLGQGMGLGLTITRRMLDDYAADIHFVEPSSGFATCIELTFPA
jgi:signal transduction histidine kinase